MKREESLRIYLRPTIVDRFNIQFSSNNLSQVQKRRLPNSSSATGRPQRRRGSLTHLSSGRGGTKLEARIHPTSTKKVLQRDGGLQHQRPSESLPRPANSTDVASVRGGKHSPVRDGRGGGRGWGEGLVGKCLLDRSSRIFGEMSLGEK